MDNSIFALTTVTSGHLAEKTFYVIELFPYPQFVMSEDGSNKQFDTYKEALDEANDCQEGIVAVFS